jgi:hypothetical protein
MTTTSSFLNLILYNSTTDQSGSFISWTNDITGSSNSNMTKIDSFSQEISGCVVSLDSDISGSVTLINSNISILSGSVTALSGSLNTANYKFQKINEFSGLGQADFTNIPQNHTHLLIMGIAGTSYTGISNIVADFNGDANQGNYNTVQWAKTTGIEYISDRYPGGIVIGNANTSSAYGAYPYGNSLFAIIPNYSGSSGFYKSAMGYLVGIEILSGGTGVGIVGGLWKSNSPITRLRIGVSYSGTRYNFIAGTKISLYGFG